MMEGIKGGGLALMALFSVLVQLVVVVGVILIGIASFVLICLIIGGMELMDIYDRYKRKPIVYK